jgi:hypothetical protein
MNANQVTQRVRNFKASPHSSRRSTTMSFAWWNLISRQLIERSRRKVVQNINNPRPTRPWDRSQMFALMSAKLLNFRKQRAEISMNYSWGLITVLRDFHSKWSSVAAARSKWFAVNINLLRAVDARGESRNRCDKIIESLGNRNEPHRQLSAKKSILNKTSKKFLLKLQ